MAESRSDLKKLIDGLNESLPEEQREQYKASTNIADLNTIIESLKSKIVEADESAEEIADGFDDSNAVSGDADAPTSDENDSGDESDAEGDENASDASDEDEDEETEPSYEGELKQCAGNHSMYADNKHNFPTKWGGRYSRDYLISKRLLAK